MRRRELRISHELLLERLNLRGCVLTGVQVHPHDGSVSVFVTDPSLSEIPECGAPFPENLKEISDARTRPRRR